MRSGSEFRRSKRRNQIWKRGRAHSPRCLHRAELSTKAGARKSKVGVAVRNAQYGLLSTQFPNAERGTESPKF